MAILIPPIPHFSPHLALLDTKVINDCPLNLCRFDVMLSLILEVSVTISQLVKISVLVYCTLNWQENGSRNNLMHIMNNPVDIITFEEFPEGLLCSENTSK